MIDEQKLIFLKLNCVFFFGIILTFLNINLIVWTLVAEAESQLWDFLKRSHHESR